MPDTSKSKTENVVVEANAVDKDAVSEEEEVTDPEEVVILEEEEMVAEEVIPEENPLERN